MSERARDGQAALNTLLMICCNDVKQEAQIAKLTKKNERLESDLKAAGERERALENELLQTRKRARDNGKLEAKVAKLTQDLAEQRVADRGLKQKNQQLEAQIAKLKKDVVAKTVAYRGRHSKLDESKNMNQQLESELKASGEREQALQKELQTLHHIVQALKKYEKRQASLMAPKLCPPHKQMRHFAGSERKSKE